VVYNKRLAALALRGAAQTWDELYADPNAKTVLDKQIQEEVANLTDDLKTKLNRESQRRWEEKTGRRYNPPKPQVQTDDQFVAQAEDATP
jgi:hypothetical protein